MWTLVQAVADAVSDSPGAPPAESGNTQVLIFVGGVIATVVSGIVAVLVAVINSKKRDTPAPSFAAAVESSHGVYERLAVLERRSDDNDERDEVQDRRLDDIEQRIHSRNDHWTDTM